MNEPRFGEKFIHGFMPHFIARAFFHPADTVVPIVPGDDGVGADYFRKKQGIVHARLPDEFRRQRGKAMVIKVGIVARVGADGFVVRFKPALIQQPQVGFFQQKFELVLMAVHPGITPPVFQEKSFLRQHHELRMPVQQRQQKRRARLRTAADEQSAPVKFMHIRARGDKAFREIGRIVRRQNRAGDSAHKWRRVFDGD